MRIHRIIGVAVLAVLLGLIGVFTIAAEDERVVTKQKPTTRLYVRTIPAGAKIVLDGEELGTSDGLFLVPPGVKKITLEMDGYDPKGETVEVRDGWITRVEVELKKRPQQPVRDPGTSGTKTAETIPKRLQRLPEGWKVQASLSVPQDRIGEFEKVLGGKILALSNTIFAAHGQRVQVNLIECATRADAEISCPSLGPTPARVSIPCRRSSSRPCRPPATSRSTHRSRSFASRSARR